MLRWGAVGAVVVAVAVSSTVVTPLLGGIVALAPPLGSLAPGGTIVLHVSVRDPESPRSPGCLLAETEPPNEAHLPVSGVTSRGLSCIEGGGGPTLILTPPVARGVLVLTWNRTETRVPFLVPAGTATPFSVELREDRVWTSRDSLESWTGQFGWMVTGTVQAGLFAVFLAAVAAGARPRWSSGCLTLATLLWIPLSQSWVPHVGGFGILLGWALLAFDGLLRVRALPPGKNVQADPASPP